MMLFDQFHCLNAVGPLRHDVYILRRLQKIRKLVASQLFVIDNEGGYRHAERKRHIAATISLPPGAADQSGTLHPPNSGPTFAVLGVAKAPAAKGIADTSPRLLLMVLSLWRSDSRRKPSP
jgi:hypothetical protein